MRELMIEESKKIQLELLETIHVFCMNYGIKYYLMWGTLLGAVRHKGFIPWDDDVDIIMFRDDYDRFCRTFNSEYAKIVECKSCDDYYLPIGKVIDTRTVLLENVKAPIELGVYIDIFVLDALSDSEKRNNIARRKLLLLRDLLMLNIVPSSTKRKGIRKIIYSILKPLSYVLNMNTISRRMDDIAKSINVNIETAKRFAPLLTPDPNATKNFVFSKSLFEPSAMLEFENKKFCAPGKYVDILKMRYGDFMKFPPIEEQVSHHEYKQYLKSEFITLLEE